MIEERSGNTGSIGHQYHGCTPPLRNSCFQKLSHSLDEELPLSSADRHIIEADLEVIETLDAQIKRLQAEMDEIAAT
jgi:hypothetical protein